MRQHIPDAGGLVIATDAASARAYKKMLEQVATTEELSYSPMNRASERNRVFGIFQDRVDGGSAHGE